MTPDAFDKALKVREECMEEVAQGSGVDMRQMYDAIRQLRRREKRARP
jgi:hypothetical protein